MYELHITTSFSNNMHNIKTQEPQQQQQQQKEAPRINPNSLIKIKDQIRYVKILKQHENKPTAPASPSYYRKPTKTVEELKNEREEQKVLQQVLSKTESKNISLKSLYDSAIGKTPPIVLVDGYNVLHKV